MSIDTGAIERFDHLLDVDRSTAVVTAMVGLTAIWWTLLYTGRVPMPGMMALMEEGIPMAAPGAMERGVVTVGTFGAVVGYIVMWAVMMWAMMYPAMTRFAREYADALRGSVPEIVASLIAFFVGYNAVWALSGVIPLGIDAVLPGGIYGFTQANTHLAIGGALVLTGLYQLSPFKLARLRDCCACVTSRDADPARALEEGITHGLSCVTVCFGVFFLVMPVFGEMNFFWMVVLTAVVTVERLPDWGRELAIATGVVAFLAGLVVLLVQPALPVSFAMSM